MVNPQTIMHLSGRRMNVKLKVKKLEAKNIGQFIYYIPFKGSDPKDWQRGKIKSFDNKEQRAFIVYNCNDQWNCYKDYTAAATRYEDLYLPIPRESV